MPYVYSNDGLTFQWHDPRENYQLHAGEQIIEDGSTVATPAQLTAAFPGYAAATAPKPAPKQLTLDSLAAALQAKGILSDTDIQAAKK